MADSFYPRPATLEALETPIEFIDLAQADIEEIALDIIQAAARSGIDLPEHFAQQIAHAIAKRARRSLLMLAWAFYRAGIDGRATPLDKDST